MDDNFEKNQEVCVKIVKDALYPIIANGEISDAIVGFVEHCVKLAFSRGYDIGYCVGWDDCYIKRES